MQTIRVPIPKTRDPFVNTPMLAIGPGKDGLDRFWISSYNANVGCMGVMVDEYGRERIYRFNNPTLGGFYSAVQEDPDTLWLCGFLSQVVCLKLSTGKFKVYETGLPHALVFQGMALDKKHGKLFVFAYPTPENQAFSFDIKQGSVSKVYKGICESHYMRASFPNGDGTWSVLVNCPVDRFLHWNPATDELSSFDPSQFRGCRKKDQNYIPGRIISDGQGRWYFPGCGWFNPRLRFFDKRGPRPEREMTWIARQGQLAWGIDPKGDGAHVGQWDMRTGKVRELCVVPDAGHYNVNITGTGGVVAINCYGNFYRFDRQTSQIESSRWLATDSIGHIDCLRRMDSERLLGTPFITQRFFEVNLRTKKGFDCGRAAPGGGEILKTWKIHGRIYMAAYTGAELMEYDPSLPIGFPENPRMVAKPLSGMRPIADADDGRNIYYACSHHYAKLGCVLTKYDTRTGVAFYADDPVPGQAIRSMVYDKTSGMLLCGTNHQADCSTCPPDSNRSYLVKINAADLKVVEKIAMPEGIGSTGVYGWLDKNSLLCTGFSFEHKSRRWFTFQKDKNGVPEWEDMRAWTDDWSQFIYAGKPGLFVLLNKHSLELWDMKRVKKRRTLMARCPAGRVFVDDRSVLLAMQKQIVILDNCL